MKRRSLPALAAALVALAAPATAWGGGFATVGLSSLPTDVGAGETWTVDMTILQHGRTPLRGVQPKLTIARGGERRTFRAFPTDAPGVYRARVVFATAGTWTLSAAPGWLGLEEQGFGSFRIGRTSASPFARMLAAVMPFGGVPVASGPQPGRAVFAKLGCGACHTLAASGARGTIGPDLDAAVGLHTRESLTAKITSPGVYSSMPPGFAARADAAEIDALVSFLLAQRT